VRACRQASCSGCTSAQAEPSARQATRMLPRSCSITALASASTTLATPHKWHCRAMNKTRGWYTPRGMLAIQAGNGHMSFF